MLEAWVIEELNRFEKERSIERETRLEIPLPEYLSDPKSSKVDKQEGGVVVVFQI